jgi:hypothetical protein
MSEIIILGAHHGGNLWERVVEHDQPQTVRTQVLLEDHQDTYGSTEQRLAAYAIDDAGALIQRIGYLPKDAFRGEGRYLATLHRPPGRAGRQKRTMGTLKPLIGYENG